MDVTFKLLDNEFSIADDAVDQLANRHDADHSVSFKHLKMPHALVARESQALLDGLLLLHTHDAPIHDISNSRRVRCHALKHDIARIASLGMMPTSVSPLITANDPSAIFATASKAFHDEEFAVRSNN